MTRALTFILLLLISLALAWLFNTQNALIQKQQEQYEVLKSDYKSLNKRLNALEQPELLRAHKKPKGWGDE